MLKKIISGGQTGADRAALDVAIKLEIPHGGWIASRAGDPVAECLRCGICCKKGGPAFHLEDSILIENGIILSKYLYTIRKGEPAYDNVKTRLAPVPSDIIKIKGRGTSWVCVFFDHKKNACRIYENRPIECRALKCWDTREIERIYARDRLTRKDLLSKIEGLWDLIEDHQRRCSYEEIKTHIDALNADLKEEALKEINAILQYDIHLRQVAAESGRIDPEQMDFLFGRPLTQTMTVFGFKVIRKGATYCLIPVDPIR